MTVSDVVGLPIDVVLHLVRCGVTLIVLQGYMQILFKLTFDAPPN